MPNLLIELGTEELPAGYIAPALEQLVANVAAALDGAAIPHGESRTAATPRKLAVLFSDVAERQPDSEKEIMGPSAKAALDADGKPTRAAEGFARGQGLSIDEVKYKDTPKGRYAYVVKREAGRPTAAVLAERLPQAITSLRFPKSMRWQTGGIYFARPLRTILALLGSEVIAFGCGGVRSDRFTHGHPFLAPGAITIEVADWDGYSNLLRAASVVVDIAERKQALRQKIEAVLRQHGSHLTNEELLDDVTNLLEYPNIFVGHFDEDFLKIPAPAVEQAMIVHQSYFPVRDHDEKLLPLFIAVMNRDDQCAEIVREGNERILRSRLGDAAFFWEHDCRTPLAAKIDGLKQIVSHARLGSYYDRTQRIVQLSEAIAEAAGFSQDVARKARRAAELCKVDLLTAMVGEFSKLQGIMGRECALRDGEDPEVAAAIAEHYAPRSATDELPQTDAGIVVALAEKLDNLVGCFAADLAPTGSQDPYALRRAVYGIIRIIMEKRVKLPLSPILARARELLPQNLPKLQSVEGDVLGFFRERLNQWALERGYQYDHINAAIGPGIDDLLLFERRLNAVKALAPHKDWEDLVIVVQRTFNIFKNARPEGQVKPELFDSDDERALWQVYVEREPAIRRRIEAQDFEAASLGYRAAFSAPVQRFFDNVFVNVEDAAVRNNRLLLMKLIHELYARHIADLTQIVLGGA